jgi:2-phosphoglycerate kinase
VRSGFPRVILIGGAPQCGKSTVARRLAAKMGYDLLATDDLGVAVRALTSPESHPDLHAMFREDYREYYVRHTPEELWRDALQAHTALWPGVRRIVLNRLDWGHPCVVEGWALLPQLTEALPVDGLAAFWLVVDQAVLAARVRADDGFHAGASDPERMMHNFLERSRRYNQHLLADAGRTAGRVLRIAADQTADDIVALMGF